MRFDDRSVKSTAMALAVLFLFPVPALASQVFQQLTDSSRFGDINSASVTHILPLGSFIAYDDGPIEVTCLYAQTCSGIPYSLIVASNPSSSGGSMSIYLSTSSDAVTAVNSGAVADWLFHVDAYAADDFISAYAMNTLNGATNYQPGQKYYIFLTASGPAGFGVRTAADGTLYGFFTDGNGTSIPISPNIPGFADVGISTSSAAVNCAGNFATSSGFLADTASNIAVGLCDVGLFLFVPNVGVTQQLESFASSTQTHFPFSWVAQVNGAFASLDASSTSNFVSLRFGLGSLGIGSTTPMGNILPDFDIMSTTTVMKYLPSPIWTSILWLISAGLWLTLGMNIFHNARARFRRV